MRIELNGWDRRAAVDTRGGELISYRDEGDLEYIWQGDPAYWEGRNPLLFPVIGACRDGVVAFGGREYPIQRHGFAREREFTLVDRGEDWAELELREDAESLACYPFSFRLRVRQQLHPDGFSTAVTVHNPGEGPLPFCLGAHTAFRCPLLPGERFEDYRLIFQQGEDCPSLVPQDSYLDRERTMPCLEGTDTLVLDHSVFDRVDTLVLEGLRSHRVRLCRPETGRGVEVDFSGFPILALWTVPGKQAPYLCIEPWHGGPAMAGESREMTDKAYCITLDPGQSRTLSYRVRTL